MIQIECNCGRMLFLDDQAADRQGQCPACDQPLRIPPLSEIRSRARPQTVSWQLGADGVATKDTRMFTLGRRRQRRWRVLAIAVVLVAAWLATLYGLKQTSAERAVDRAWSELEPALAAPATAWDAGFARTLQLAGGAGKLLPARLADCYFAVETPEVRRRVVVLLAYLSTQQGLDSDAITALAHGIASGDLELRRWSFTAMALAGHGQGVAARLEPFGDGIEVTWRSRTQSGRAATILFVQDPRGDPHCQRVQDVVEEVLGTPRSGNR